MNKFIIKTFGCKTNQVESEYIVELLRNNGYTQVFSALEASFCIINSCTVTQTADRKVLSYINSVKKKNENLKIILMRC